MGVEIPPCWRVVSEPGVRPGGRHVDLVVAPGQSFGDGRHPTTQLCLQALPHLLRPTPSSTWVLDFGCGSGILALAAARLGARVWAIENDPAALEEARANAQRNALAAQIECATALDQAPGPFGLIVANILSGVLMEHAPALSGRLAPGGALLLSGLVATDVPVLCARYAPMLGGRRPTVAALDDWRALLWR